jgi:hypothetical protein
MSGCGKEQSNSSEDNPMEDIFGYDARRKPATEGAGTAPNTDRGSEEGKDLAMTEDQMLNLETIRKQAGLQIDPANAEVEWWYVQTLDPYGDDPDLPEEFQQVERGYFARSPGSDVWVHFYDLPQSTRDALWNRYSKRLAFPAGLEDLDFPDALNF